MYLVTVCKKSSIFDHRNHTHPETKDAHKHVHVYVINYLHIYTTIHIHHIHHSSMSAIQCTYLATKHPHPRDEYISFKESTHTYTIRNPDTNKLCSTYTSVTTWCHSHFEPFDSDKVIAKMMQSPKWPNSPYFGMTPDEIKTQWKARGKEATTAGTLLHATIEAFYNQELDHAQEDQEDKAHTQELAQLAQHTQSVEFQQFLAFDEMRKCTFPTLEPYRTEWTIFDESLRLAGSVDMLFRDTSTNELWIYDWKRCKEIRKYNPWQNAITPELEHLPDTNYWHYALQLNTYRTILERKYGVHVAGMCLVVFHPNQTNYQRIKVPRLEEVTACLESRLTQEA